MNSDRYAEISDQILEVLKSIPIFDRLTLPEVHKIFDIFRPQRYEAGEVIYRIGSPSDDMFILMEGILSVRTSAGIEVAQVTPIGLVGEMGLLTHSPRSAEVIAIDDMTGLFICKADLTNLFIRDTTTCVKVLLNIIKIIARKIHNTNIQIEKLKASAPHLSKEIDEILAGNVFLY